MKKFTPCMQVKLFSRVVALSLALGAVLASGPAAAVCPLYGILQTTTGRAAQEYSSGVRLATVELSWSSYQPSDGTFSTTYRDQKLAEIQAFRNAGFQVVLDLGFQYPPSWIFGYANSRFVNQFGDSFADPGPGWNGVNAVFNNTMRTKQDAYLQHVFADLGTNFYAVRMGWGWYSELNYPRADYNGRTNCYWAYDAIAQGNATGLPSGVAVCPVRGWKPGQASTNHTSASQFINWYFDSLKNYQNWQISTLRKYYAGTAQMLYPGWGVRPGQTDGAVAVDLNGTTSVEINGEIQRGSDYARFVAAITDPKIVVYTTWLDAPFGNDASSVPADWTPPHYLASLAAANSLHLAVGGENTGRNDLAAMQRCFQRAQTYGLTGFMWAFESDLFDTSGAYASLSQYGSLIAQYSCAAVPAAPTGLTASAGNAQISLSWNASSGATSYTVKRSTVNGSGYANIASPTTTSYTNTGLTNGTTYYYVVSATNASGTSGNSTQASATPTAASSGNTHGGTWAAKGILAATPSYNNLSQVATVATNSTYVASIWIKGTGSVLLNVKAGSWGADITSVRCNATGGWTQVSTPSFSTGANTQITVIVQDQYADDPAGTVYIDDAFLGISGGTNRLGNAGFESGAVTWGWGGVFTIVQPGGGSSGNTHVGTWAGKGVLPAAPGYTNLYQVATVASNSTYVASLWIKGTGSVILNIKAGNWGADITSVRCNATSTWTQVTTPSFSTGANTQMTFIIQDQYGDDPAGTVYIDDAFLGISGSTNRLGNPGFESGDITWGHGTAFSVVQNP